MVTVLPPDKVRRRAILAMDLDDHALTVLVADMTSPDHQLITLYSVRTRRRGCGLRFGQMSRLRQDRGLCLSGSSICS